MEHSTGGEPMLAGKVVVVTGAGRGIGQAISIAMAEEGARVVVNDLGTSLSGDGADLSPAESVVATIKAAGGNAIADGSSVAEWASASAIVDRAMQTFGRIDAVVHCAGILRDVLFHKMSPEDFETVLRVHLFGAFNICRAAAPHFRQQQSGSMVHMTSSAGLIGAVGQANYATAKMGIVGLSRSIAMDMARFGVRSNCIAPHAFSRMIESIPGRSPETVERRKRIQRADQVAPLAVYLCSDAAKAVSGQVLGVRGNEIYLYNQNRPIRTLHQSQGWTPQLLSQMFVPALGSSFTPAAETRDVFGWEAI
jgi:NAD(P)-dependent dehydrogenase (short-subunit alcohol dehydrogenase family)